MSYQVLAQKYRPQTFDDVVGQEAATKALKNSISRGRIANAYMFCGPRGVGKTSVARLVAKTINCKDPKDNGPCNKCSSCLEISRGNNIDVLEIDGASNRGIDEIRTLRESVKFAPSLGKYKVYIIDEVHMLTPEAFNALLKTLEEPPAHVKFIFATTEAHKVLPTIMSRCQRFDFKRIPPNAVYNTLLEIAKKEKVGIEDKAALFIARSSDGSLRDALVVLDQMVSFSDKKITADDVLELLGMLHKDKIFALSRAVLDNTPDKVINTLDELISSGKDPVYIATSLLSHYRDLLVLKASGGPTSDMAFSDDEMDEMNKQKEKASLEEMLYVLQNISQCIYVMKGTMFTRAPLEITLVRMAKRGDILSLKEIAAKLEGLDLSGVSATGQYVPPVQPAGTYVKKNDGLSASPAVDAEKTGYKVKTRDIPESDNNGDVSVAARPSLDNKDSKWEAILGHVRGASMSVFTLLSHAKPIEFGEKKIVIGFSEDHAFKKEMLETEENKKVLTKTFADVIGGTPTVEFRILGFLGKTSKENPDNARKNEAKKAMNPIIEKAMDVFGGQVVRDVMENDR
ncbi:MAG TPA: DNA polymerase III subunit gamma/tau [Candidatus Omnitrophota bacterium]|nr:DNA polymerase III subunit gamma/tau [Candidatus Omnitrophota bacterium]HPS20563.1 DNA polymerase III subunit gamma/tau [Candidatus Omnitrophota bacterium]